MNLNDDEIKARASILDVTQDYLPLKKQGPNYVCCCPFHNEKSGSFTVSPSKNIYTCFGCGKTGDAIQFLIEFKKITYTEALKQLADKYNILPKAKEHQIVARENRPYKKPNLKNQAKLSEKLLLWFKGRGISSQTLDDLKVTEGPEYIPQVKTTRNTIQFNYFRNGELINTKFRDAEKNFKLVAGAELILYNLDAVKQAKEIIIVEGEIDALSLFEAGYKNVVSVPNGAAVTKTKAPNLIYLDNCIDDLPADAKYILALDNDGPGIALRDELARRLGFENCYKVIFNDCKDANECLLKYGIGAIRTAFENKTEFPIAGVYRASDIDADINDYYENGLPPGHGIGIPEFDEMLKFHLGYITTLTGIPGDGKSEWLDFLSVRLNILHGWKFAMYSPENYPMQLHFSKYAEKFVGKPWGGTSRLNSVELKQVKRHFESNFFFINPDEDFSLTNILSTVRQLIRKKGVKCFIIDAWNKLEHKYTDNETRYISEKLDQITVFCQRNQVHCFLVAHPTKVQKKHDGTFEIPNLYSIAGSANFFNKTANGICVYRDRTAQYITDVYVQKVKFKHWGHTGNVSLSWDRITGRYYKGHPDYDNWIAQAETQTAAELDEADPIAPVIPALQSNTGFLSQNQETAEKISKNDVEDYPNHDPDFPF